MAETGTVSIRNRRKISERIPIQLLVEIELKMVKLSDIFVD
jgi:hypothetical protein